MLGLYQNPEVSRSNFNPGIFGLFGRNTSNKKQFTSDQPLLKGRSPSIYQVLKRLHNERGQPSTGININYITSFCPQLYKYCIAELQITVGHRTLTEQD